MGKIEPRFCRVDGERRAPAQSRHPRVGGGPASFWGPKKKRDPRLREDDGWWGHEIGCWWSVVVCRRAL